MSGTFGFQGGGGSGGAMPTTFGLYAQTSFGTKITNTIKCIIIIIFWQLNRIIIK
jgi:hypothetical protein